jgi:hypothetical protein
METTDIREIGGNSLKLWRGNINSKIAKFFQTRSEKLIKEGSKTIISNPNCKFINHCTILFNFTINNTDKYQLVHQGRFTEKYKSWRKIEKENEIKIAEWEEAMNVWESNEKKELSKVNSKSNSDVNNVPTTPPAKPDVENSPLNNDEMFQTIIYQRKHWYKKDIL